MEERRLMLEEEFLDPYVIDNAEKIRINTLQLVDC